MLELSKFSIDRIAIAPVEPAVSDSSNPTVALPRPAQLATVYDLVLSSAEALWYAETPILRPNAAVGGFGVCDQPGPQKLGRPVGRS